MTNKEKYKQAFSVLKASDDLSWEVEKMAKLNKKRTMKTAVAAAAIALCVVAGGSTTAYAMNVGNIQRQVQIWLKGDQTDAVMTIQTDGAFGEERPLTEEEIMEHLNEPEVVYEEDGSAWIYLYDQKMEITDKFDEDGICRVEVQHEDLTYYMTVYYQDGWSMSNEKYID